MPVGRASVAGTLAGLAAAVAALLLLNLLGFGSILWGRLLTGFLVGGGVFLVVSSLVDALRGRLSD